MRGSTENLRDRPSTRVEGASRRGTGHPLSWTIFQTEKTAFPRRWKCLLDNRIINL